MPSKERSKLKEKQLVEEVDVGAVPAGDPPRASKKAKPASKNKAAAQEIEEESTGLVAVVVGATGAVGRVRMNLIFPILRLAMPLFAAEGPRTKTNGCVASPTTIWPFLVLSAVASSR